jgi:hypothetical protein
MKRKEETMFKSEARKIEMVDESRNSSVASSSNGRHELREEIFDQIHHLEGFTPVAFTILADESAGDEV